MSSFPRSPRTIALIGRYQSAGIADALRQLAKYLHERGVTVVVEEETAANVGSGGDVQ